jgi:hypothetical protein
MIEYAAILDRVHPEDRAVRQAAIEQALKTKSKLRASGRSWATFPA